MSRKPCFEVLTNLWAFYQDSSSKAVNKGKTSKCQAQYYNWPFFIYTISMHHKSLLPKMQEADNCLCHTSLKLPSADSKLSQILLSQTWLNWYKTLRYRISKIKFKYMKEQWLELPTYFNISMYLIYQQ